MLRINVAWMVITPQILPKLLWCASTYNASHQSCLWFIFLVFCCLVKPLLTHCLWCVNTIQYLSLMCPQMSKQTQAFPGMMWSNITRCFLTSVSPRNLLRTLLYRSVLSGFYYSKPIVNIIVPYFVSIITPRAFSQPSVQSVIIG